MNQPLNLFLVDDAPEITQIVQVLARRAGYSLSHCEDGPSALRLLLHEAASRPPFDLILLDVNLPGMSGFEVYRELRQATPGSLPAPVALFVQESLSGLLAEALGLGLDCCVAKDLLGSPSQWAPRVVEVIQLSHSGPQTLCTDSLPPVTEEFLPRFVQGLRETVGHSRISRLGEDGLAGLWSRIVQRLGLDALQHRVDLRLYSDDLWGRRPRLIDKLTPLLAHNPRLLEELKAVLIFQVACLFGKDISQHVCAPLLAVFPQLNA